MPTKDRILSKNRKRRREEEGGGGRRDEGGGGEREEEDDEDKEKKKQISITSKEALISERQEISFWFLFHSAFLKNY